MESLIVTRISVLNIVLINKSVLNINIIIAKA